MLNDQRSNFISPSVARCPAVSVVLPVRNGARTIEAAVRSVLTQTFRDFELIVIDDGSTDGTAAILETLAGEDQRLRVITQAPGGIVAALNAGISSARALLIARMDADDVCLPERFARQVSYLNSNPACVAVGTKILKVDSDLKPRRASAPIFDAHQHKLTAQPLAFPPRCPQIAHPTAMIRAEALRRVGGYRGGALAPAQDRDLWWRLARTGEIHVINEVLLLYRVHKTSMSRSARRETIVSILLADCSAIAVASGRDDTDILATIPADLSSKEIVRRYENLLGTNYPLSDYMLYYFARERVLPLAEEVSALAVLGRIAMRCFTQPFRPSPWRVLGCYALHSHRSPRALR